VHHVADLVDWQFNADDFHVHHVADLVDWQFNADDFHMHHVADLVDWQFNAEHMHVGEQSIQLARIVAYTMYVNQK